MIDPLTGEKRARGRASRNKNRPRRKKCPRTCGCLCHDVDGGPMHPNEPCPGKVTPT